MTRYTQEYERLRSQVSAAWPQRQCAAVTSPLRGIGLALLLRDGLPAWIQAVRQVLSQAAASAGGNAGAAPSPRAPLALPGAGTEGIDAPSASSTLLATGRQHDLTTLLASLVLSARRRSAATPIKEASPCH